MVRACAAFTLMGMVLRAIATPALFASITAVAAITSISTTLVLGLPVVLSPAVITALAAVPVLRKRKAAEGE